MSESPARAMRINEQLVAYWHELRGDRPLPFEHEINSEKLADIWGGCFLVTVTPGGFGYDYLGRDLLEAYGDDWTGREITETLLYPHPAALFAIFRQVKASGEPSTDDGEFTNSHGALIKYRSSVLPLAAHGQPGVQFLLGGMRWKRFEPAA